MKNTLENVTVRFSLYTWQVALNQYQEKTCYSKLHAHFVGGRDFPGGPEVENPPAEQESLVQSLAREDPPEKGMVTHSSVCLENSVSRGAWWARVHEVAKRWTRLSG